MTNQSLLENYPRLVLASQSPRRRRLLESLGISFQVVSPGVDGPSDNQDPGPRALDIAAGKAWAVAKIHPRRWVLAADTLVWQDGEFFPKPQDLEQAQGYLAQLLGKSHEVWTGVCLLTPCGEAHGQADSALVAIKDLGLEEQRSYLATQEWVGKAGGYAIQGHAGTFATVVQGEQETVIGLSTQTVRALLRQAGTCLEEFCG